MPEQFPYCNSVVHEDALEVEDIGNCAIKAYNDAGFYWILIVKTCLGITRIFNYGPNIDDISAIINCSTSIEQLNYNTKKIRKEINIFLNDFRKKITQAYEITPDEAISCCYNLIDIIKDNIF